MNFEKFSPYHDPKEFEKLFDLYTLEEKELLLEQLQLDLQKQKEKVYSNIKNKLSTGKIDSLTDKEHQFFLNHLKEEDFEFAALLNKK